MRVRLLQPMRLQGGRLGRPGELVDEGQVPEAFLRWTVRDIDRPMFAKGAPDWRFIKEPRHSEPKPEEPLHVEELPDEVT